MNADERGLKTELNVSQFFSPLPVLRGRVRVGVGSKESGLNRTIKNPHPSPPPGYMGRVKERTYAAAEVIA
jgi:hypothetical protein